MNGNQCNFLTKIACVCCFTATSCLSCEYHFHRGRRSSDHCWLVCFSHPSVCHVIVFFIRFRPVIEQRTLLPLPGPPPTWPSCQRHGSVPWQEACALCECKTERWDRANWGSSNYCGCPLFGYPGGGERCFFHLFSGNLKCTSSGLHISTRLLTAQRKVGLH